MSQKIMEQLDYDFSAMRALKKISMADVVAGLTKEMKRRGQAP